MSYAEVIQVIRTRLEKRGKGVPGDPIRMIEQFWSLDGVLLAENDTWPNCKYCQSLCSGDRKDEGEAA